MMASAAGWGVGKKVAATALGLLTGSGAVLAYEVDKSVRADMVLHPPAMQGCCLVLLLSSDTTGKVVVCQSAKYGNHLLAWQTSSLLTRAHESTFNVIPVVALWDA